MNRPKPSRSSPSTLRVDGTVINCLRGATFMVQLANGVLVHAYLSGPLRCKAVRVISGDLVSVEVSIYNLTRGRIIERSLEPEVRSLMEE